MFILYYSAASYSHLITNIYRHDERNRRYSACTSQQVQQDKRWHQETEGSQRDGGVSSAKGHRLKLLRAKSNHLIVVQSDLWGESLWLERAYVPPALSLSR